MQKLFIKNRKGQKIAVVVEQPEGKSKGLAFVMHGLGGFKEQPHIRAMIEAFLENSYTTISFDTINTLGESDGNYEDATTTNYYEDLEDVISWAKNQDWYQEPFCLAGHSLGGISTAFYAENFPDQVKALAPISTVVSGQFSVETKRHQAVAEEWERTGWREEKSQSIPGLIKRLRWSHVEDRLKYDLLPKVDNLTMPVLMIVGDQDISTPLEHQQILFEKLPGQKELHVIKGSPHTFRASEHLAELKQIFDKWIKKIT